MALTVSNISTLGLLRVLNQTGTEYNNILKRLSTGYRINRAADDPAGLIALNKIDSDLAAVNAAISNDRRTDAMLTVADGALTEVTSLLTDIHRLAVASASTAGLTASELAANQAEIDSAIASIDRLMRTTEFNGRRLLDGSLAIQVTSVGANISDVHVYSRDPNTATGSGQTISVTLVDAATLAAASGDARLVANSASEDTTIQIRGALGAEVIEISAGENLSSIVAKINEVSSLTGVVASQAGGVETGAINLYSTDYGSDQFVKVTVLSGGTAYGSGNDFQDINVSGTDAVVTVNGAAASAQGNEVYFSAGGLSLSFTIGTGFSESSTETFTVSDDGGATFQLGTDTRTRVTIGIDGLYSQRLGTAALGYLSSLKSGGAASLLNDPNQAAQIAKAALEQVATVRGRLGAFQAYQVETSLSSMETLKEGLTAARSTIADTDYAVETANLNRQNVLMQAAITLLGLTKQQHSSVLNLLM